MSQVNIVNDLYKKRFAVDASTYDVVLSYFRSLTSNQTTAAAMTENMFRIADELQVDVLELMESTRGQDKLKVTMMMAYYLNSFSDKTVMYGVSNLVQPNHFVARNIVQ